MQRFLFTPCFVMSTFFLASMLASPSAQAGIGWFGKMNVQEYCLKCNGEGGDCVYCDDWHRSGHANQISCLAKLSNTPAYCGYFVGGGAFIGGSGRCPDDGVWGWDYFGTVLTRGIILNWWHGQRHQGGSGNYKTDGPHIIHHH